MFETYRMLGEQHEAELVRGAERANAGAGGARRSPVRLLASLVNARGGAVRFARSRSRRANAAPNETTT